jgi:flagellar basal body P-ring protein FlgI
MNMVLFTQEDDRTMAGRIHKILNKTIMMKINITVDVFQTYTQGTPKMHALSRACTWNS